MLQKILPLSYTPRRYAPPPSEEGGYLCVCQKLCEEHKKPPSFARGVPPQEAGGAKRTKISSKMRNSLLYRDKLFGKLNAVRFYYLKRRDRP